MLRKSALITLISTAAFGLAINEAAARAAAGNFAGVRAANSHFVTRMSPSSNFGPGFHIPRDRGFSGGYALTPGAALKIQPKIYQPYGINPAGDATIKQGYGTSLKPLPVPPIVAAKNYPGTKVIVPAPTTPTAPATPPTPPMHWPHKPGHYGTPIVTSAPVVPSAPDLAATAPAAMPVMTTATSAPAQPFQASQGACTCLSKQYSPQGTAVFLDRCTNEVATTAPRQTGAVVPDPMPQQLAVTK